MNIDKLKLDKPAPLTNAERQKRWRAKQASRAVAVHFSAHTEATAALLHAAGTAMAQRLRKPDQPLALRGKPGGRPPQP